MAAEEEQDAPFRLVTQVNKILHSIFSNVEVYIKNQQINNSNGLYVHKSYSYKNFKEAMSENNGVLHCEGYDYEKSPDEFREALLFEPFFTRRLKMLSKMEVRRKLIRARPYFHMISHNPTLVLELLIAHSTFVVYILKDDYHEKRMDMFTLTPPDIN